MGKRYLLDTNVLIWFLEGSSNLSLLQRQAMEADRRNNFVSIASLWEMAVKISVGKLNINVPFPQIEKLILFNGFRVLPITFEDTLAVSTLPLHHKDPFDRIIIAQAMTNKLTVITSDHFFPAYQINLV